MSLRCPVLTGTFGRNCVSLWRLLQQHRCGWEPSGGSLGWGGTLRLCVLGLSPSSAVPCDSLLQSASGETCFVMGENSLLPAAPPCWLLCWIPPAGLSSAQLQRAQGRQHSWSQSGRPWQCWESFQGTGRQGGSSQLGWAPTPAKLTSHGTAAGRYRAQGGRVPSAELRPPRGRRCPGSALGGQHGHGGGSGMEILG